MKIRFVHLTTKIMFAKSFAKYCLKIMRGKNKLNGILQEILFDSDGLEYIHSWNLYYVTMIFNIADDGIHYTNILTTSIFLKKLEASSWS